MFVKIVNHEIRLIRSQPQHPIFNGAARPDWLLRGKHIVDAKLGQYVNVQQLELFVRFALQNQGSITYITLTRVPPTLKQQIYAIARDVPVSFISLTPF